METVLTKAQRRKVLAAVSVGTYMGALDSSVVNLALPGISTHFNAALSTVEWVVMAYLLIISSLLLTYGRLGDLYGHKRIYISGFLVFTIGSLICGIAPSIGFLIFFRALQALGAGMLMSMGPAIITDSVPPQERGKSLGLIGVAVSVALTTGPILGGILTENFGWQSIFLINIPVGIFGLLWGKKVIPDHKGQEVKAFDIKGAVLLFLALICILFPLSYAEKIGWINFTILGLLTLGILLLGIFLYLESRVPYPMIDLKLFRNRLFSMGNLSLLLNYVAQFSVIFLMPFYLQQLLGLSPDKAGLMLIPMPLVTMVIAPLSGTISDRIDTRYISSLGMFITAVGLWRLSTLQVNSSTFVIMLSLAITGLGVGMFQTPNNSAIMGSVTPNRRGLASSLLATMRNVGMVLGVAISGAIFSNTLNYLNQTFTSQGITGKTLTVQSFTGAIHITYLVTAGLALAAVFTSLVRGPMKSQASS